MRMTTTALIQEIHKLPWAEKLLVVEKTIHAIRQESRRTGLEAAAEALHDDYRTDAELTAFTALDGNDFYEAR